MVGELKLHAKQINHGQSEIWLCLGDSDLTTRRTLATNEVVNVPRRLCASEIFQAFYADYYSSLGRECILSASNLDEIATEFRLHYVQ